VSEFFRNPQYLWLAVAIFALVGLVHMTVILVLAWKAWVRVRDGQATILRDVKDGLKPLRDAYEKMTEYARQVAIAHSELFDPIITSTPRRPGVSALGDHELRLRDLKKQLDDHLRDHD
jgi:hypothetical protein